MLISNSADCATKFNDAMKLIEVITLLLESYFKWTNAAMQNVFNKKYLIPTIFIVYPIPSHRNRQKIIPNEKKNKNIWNKFAICRILVNYLNCAQHTLCAINNIIAK